MAHAGWPKVPPPAPVDPNDGLKKGKYCYLGGAKVPCKIDDVKTSKTGKHGHAKKVVKGYPVAYSQERDAEITKKSVEEVFSSHGHPVAFVIIKNTFDVTAFEDDVINCITEEGEEVSFPFPKSSQGEVSPYFLKLKALFEANDDAAGDLFWTMTVAFFPIHTGEIIHYAESWKEGTD
mmetsp:Transcript_15774/g.17493  ORF Transcript_15774/g.17493 Transcript_15774/m.17493 type:complete len:178 (+) Transcript_15774:49-582(+)|eukprot:CAMPEP_0205819242 /NCGR_PEP_ID=MMETSP0206-20130828/1516_1 /ASSEMBLY_ACC=CAM_ASM_000279 /TAXON_ID=36767 /ORGANISM="Euplotes focardii, Strain TN1" /LENGTH=177 /DNA_ID=CAMNT_0053112577 /DNA_START=36 /DNA_END=569 /DNA_ORIENTATION=-